jgi:hypothetical protein
MAKKTASKHAMALILVEQRAKAKAPARDHSHAQTIASRSTRRAAYAHPRAGDWNAASILNAGNLAAIVHWGRIAKQANASRYAICRDFR